MATASPYSPLAFPPQEQEQPVAPPPRNEGLWQKWNSWIQNPANRAALMQFGAQLLQPMGIGQTPLGHLGQAVAGGAEAQERARRAGLEEQSEQALNEARQAAAEAARARAAKAQQPSSGGMTDYQRARLQMAEDAAFARFVRENTEFGDEDSLSPERLAELADVWERLKARGRQGAGGPPPPPRVGEVRNGYRYTGGPPGSPDSWVFVGNVSR